MLTLMFCQIDDSVIYANKSNLSIYFSIYIDPRVAPTLQGEKFEGRRCYRAQELLRALFPDRDCEEANPGGLLVTTAGGGDPHFKRTMTLNYYILFVLIVLIF